MTLEIPSKEYKKILQDFDEFLREVWKEGTRDWSVYSREQFIRFWDRHVVESRKK